MDAYPSKWVTPDLNGSNPSGADLYAEKILWEMN